MEKTLGTKRNSSPASHALRYGNRSRIHSNVGGACCLGNVKVEIILQKGGHGKPDCIPLRFIFHSSLLTPSSGFLSSTSRYNQKGAFPWSTTLSMIFIAPAQDAISPEAKILSVKINQTSSIFNAEPSPEVDDAWASLFQYANIRITKQEVQQLGRSSVALSDGSGDYFGTLDVYHQLHCLFLMSNFKKYIRQYVHQDYYTVKDTNVPVKDHVTPDHCIEMLRQVIMCKADTALMTYEWLPDFPGPWPNFGIQHECVNWEKIDNWSKERSIDIFDPKYLHHPKIGKACL
ncbi:hypothetical protein BKA64DRAFT_637469 [Cadophora sp. MPI-SDFR-AT-0126]|nr:hypothetical protein BKA64DRAFT_637469 [Leotiomycetes sp. MPI-SDFR-AT-0126]